MCWNDITLNCSKRGGAFYSKFKAFKISLMAKNVFNFLNGHDAIWVDVLYHKYGKINFWIDSTPSFCSWFFRSLCNTAHILKPFMLYNSINPSISSLLFDPWYFEIPTSFKPSFSSCYFW